MDDVGMGFQGDVVPILNEWQAVELEWKAATSVGANNGYVKLYVNDILVSEINNLDTDTQSINDISFGVDDIPAGTSGIIYYDAFESRQGEHIGLIFTSPPQAYTKTPIPTNAGMPTPTATPSFTPTATPINSMIQNWSFDTNTNNWTAGQYLSGFSWKSGGVIEGNITGVDPMIFSADNLGINIANHRFLVIRLKNLTPATQAQFFFITNTDTSWNQAKSKIFTVAPNSDYTEYIVDMSNVAGWTGTLKRLRFDPAGSTGSFGIDHIKIGSYYVMTPTATIAPTNSPTVTITPTLPSLVQSLRSYWNFNSPSGTTVPDEATGDSTNNSASLVNGPIIESTGVEGKSVFFDGINDYATIADQAEIKNNGSFTISAWVNPASDVTESTQYIVKKGGQLNEGYGLITLSSGGTPTPAGPTTVYANGNIAFQIGGLSPHMLLGPVLSTNTWTLVTGVYDANAKEMRLYLNRELVSSQSVTGTLNMGTGALRFSSHNTANVYHGRLDEVRFYNRALSANEIQGVYGLHTPPAPSPTPTFTVTPTPAFTATSLPMDQQQWGTGQDGDLTVNTGETFNINTQTKQIGRTCADAAAYSVTLLGGTSARVNPSPAEGCLNPGDEVLLIQMQDSLSTTYNAGNYEFLRVEDVSGDTVIFNSQKIKWYGNGWRSDSNIGIGAGQIRVMLMRVPNYDNVTVNGTLTTNAFDNLRYGVLAFRVLGELQGSGSISADRKGFNNGAGYGVGQTGGNNSGGGGGSYGTKGTNGAWTNAGNFYGEVALNRIFLGSSGGNSGSVSYTGTCGSEANNNIQPCNQALDGPMGSQGGGLIWVSGQAINFSGTISSKGEPSRDRVQTEDHNGGTVYSERSGGGTGGSIRIEGANVILGNVTVAGGAGAIRAGSGGKGRVAIYYQTSYSASSIDVSPYSVQMGSPSTPAPLPTSIVFNPPSPDFGNGRDGDLLVNGTFNLSSMNSNSRMCADGGDGVAYTVTELTASSATLLADVGNQCLVTGDEVLLIHVNGSGQNLGSHEFLRVGGISGKIVYFTTPKLNYYGSSIESDDGIGTASNQNRVMLVRVPNYQDVTVQGTLTANGFDGSKNGVIAFRVFGVLSGTGTITADKLGFNNGTGYGVGTTGGVNSGGGGGSYGAKGTNGAWAASGNTYGEAALNQIFLGSSGGNAGSVPYTGGCGPNDATPCNQSLAGPLGSQGGGLIWISGQTVNFTGTISSNGEPSRNRTQIWDFDGKIVYSEYSGGGAGGSIRIEGGDVTLGNVTVAGGAGTVRAGSGGSGRIAVYYHNSFTGSFTPGYLEQVDLNATQTPPPVGPTQTSTPTSGGTPTPVPSGWQTRSYAYDEDHPHAVSSLAQDSVTVANYSYDQNGNMTCRTEDGVTYRQEYNTENRISSIQKLAEGTCDEVIKIATQWDFAYDGDGVRVATLTTTYDENGLPGAASLTAYYFGGVYELRDGAAIKYYSFMGQMVAMDDGTGLQYFLTDHLGSVAAVTDASGTLISQQRYLPFGGVRENVGNISQTDYGYTGQRNLDAGVGLMDYKARFYSPYLNRFIQPDTLIPDPSNPQDWNRFSYVRNNPINYNDPSGHVICNDEGECFTPPSNTGILQGNGGSSTPPICNAACQLGLEFQGDWNDEDKKAFVSAAKQEARRMYDVYCPERLRFECEFDSPADLYRATHGTTTLTFVESPQGFFCQRNANTGQEGVSCYKNSRGNIDPILGAHEMGHVFNALIANNGYTQPYTDLAMARNDPNFPRINAAITPGYRKNGGSNGEDFANMYSMWVFNDFPNTPSGRQRREFMERNMYFWIMRLLDRP